jgi:hypothetical protein
MSFPRAALAAASLLLLALASAPQAAEPLDREALRPATARDLELPVAPLRELPASARIAPPASAAQWIRIDPATGAILPGATPTTPRVPLLQTTAAPMRLRASSKGHLYIETRGYRSVMTMTLDEDGALHAACGDPRHAHAAGGAAGDDAGGAR